MTFLWGGFRRGPAERRPEVIELTMISEGARLHTRCALLRKARARDRFSTPRDSRVRTRHSQIRVRGAEIL